MSVRDVCQIENRATVIPRVAGTYSPFAVPQADQGVDYEVGKGELSGGGDDVVQEAYQT